MEVQGENPSPSLTAEKVANAFTDQYYYFLRTLPERVYQFYHDSSLLSRPGPDGLMTCVTTLEGINDKILSLGYDKYEIEILTADSQFSYNGGVILLVTGQLTGEDKVKRKFTQSFFLAPQSTGYFVLNDVFRYTDDHKPVETASNLANLVKASGPAAEQNQVPDPSVVNHSTPVQENDTNDGSDNCPPSVSGEVKASEKEVADAPVAPNQTAVASSDVEENTTKKSFASIVNKLRENNAPFQDKVQTVKHAAQPRATTHAPVPAELSASGGNSGPQKSPNASVKSHSIFVGKLPMTATPDQLREAFGRFGAIKPDGIQVRSKKGFCFGFVEFESSSSMEEALKADEVLVGGCKVNIERAKKNQDNNDRGRYPRDGRRNDNFRGRGNFRGHRGYGRNNSFEKRGEFSGRSYGEGRQNGGTYNRVYQNGRGRAPHEA